MTNPLPPTEPTDDDQDWPRTIQEAVAKLIQTLSQAEKDEIAAMPEKDLVFLHFGFGAKIREDFGLWRENRALLADCQRVKWEGRMVAPDIPEGVMAIHPDDASGIILRALWGE